MIKRLINHKMLFLIEKNQMKTVLEKYSATLPKFAFINVDYRYLRQKLPGSDYEILRSLDDISVRDESGVIFNIKKNYSNQLINLFDRGALVIGIS